MATLGDFSSPMLKLRKDAIKSAELEVRNFPGLLERSFIPTKYAVVSKDNSEFRVMQWNVLADALSFSDSTTNFIKCPIQALAWSNRKHRILQEILNYYPDIIALQEVDHFTDFYYPQLQELGYEGIFLPKKDSPCLKFADNSGPDGCAIFVDKERFKLEKSQELSLLDKDENPTNQVALLVKLLDKIEGRHVCCVVTHLKAKPAFEELRVAQGKSILKYLKEYIESESPEVLICGDFNAEPSEPVYSSMEKGFDNYAFKSAYKSASQNEPKFTTFKVRPNGEVKHTIDYVWHSSNLHVTGHLETPDEEEIGKDGLPCMAYPSDHLSLVFDFCWTSEFQNSVPFQDR